MGDIEVLRDGPLGLAIAATVVSALAFVAGVLITILIVWAWDEFGDDIARLLRSQR